MLSLLQSELGRYYTANTLETFWSYFKEGGVDRLFQVPLLEFATTAEMCRTSFRDLSCERVKRLSVTNASNRSLAIGATSTLGSVSSVPDLFERFIRVSHHLMRLGHFRNFPEYYVPVLAGNRYFLFHGDGFCCQLAVLFQALCREVLGEVVTAQYCRNPDFSFSHGYCRWWEGTTEMIVDPDLKTMFPASQIDTFYPKTWYINLLENLAIRLYHEIDEGMRQHLFFSFNRTYWDWLLAACNRELSHPNSRYDVTRSLCITGMVNASEVYDVMADDYDWKRTYRTCVGAYRESKGKPADGSQFLFETKEPLEIWIPPGGEFRVEGPSAALPPEVFLLLKLYFGRVAGSLSALIIPGRPAEMRCPELPWFIRIEGAAEYIVINGVKRVLHAGLIKGEGWLGMGDLEPLIPGLFMHDQSLVFEADEIVSVRVYFPINATFWNSGYLELAAKEESDLLLYASLA